MKKTLLPVTIVLFCMIGGASVSCMKLLNNISESDPCTKAFLKRRQLKKTPDTFEQSQLLQEIQVLDNLCNQHTADAYDEQQKKRQPRIR